MLHPTEPRGFFDRFGCLVVGLFLALLVLKITYGAVVALDIGFDDEGGALEHGINGTMPTPDWAPLYTLWYAALSVFVRDPVRLYLTGWFVLVAALPLLLFALARRLGAPLAPAAIVAALWALGHASDTWPFVTLFTTLLLGGAALAITYARSWSRALALTSVAVTAASFARPELAVPSAILVATVVIVAARAGALAPASIRPRAVDVALALVPFGLLREIFGEPLRGGRSWFAFGQHYAANRIEAAGLDIDPWTNFEPLLEEAFPHAHSLLAAARENPTQLEWHVLYNLRLLPREMKAFVSPVYCIPNELGKPLTWVLGVVLLAGFVALVRRRHATLWARVRLVLPLAVVVLATSLATVLLLRPRHHYVVSVTFFAFAILASGCRAFVDETKSKRWGPSSSAAFLAMLLVVVPTRAPHALPALLAAVDPPPAPLEHRPTVALLRRLRLREPVTILESYYSHGIYMRLRFAHCGSEEKHVPFSQFIRDRGIDVVVIDARLRRDTRFRDDAEFERFANGTVPEDFVFFPVPGADVVVAVRAKALEE